MDGWIDWCSPLIHIYVSLKKKKNYIRELWVSTSLHNNNTTLILKIVLLFAKKKINNTLEVILSGNAVSISSQK